MENVTQTKELSSKDSIIKMKNISITNTNTSTVKSLYDQITKKIQSRNNNNNNNNNFKSTNKETITEKTALTTTDKNTELLTTLKRVNGDKDDDDDAWVDKMDFIMSCIGFAVGLGNLWRFPYLCYKNGGGAFLIPYFITLCIAGIPVAFFEHTLGQLIGQGVLGVWELCPALKGVAYATIILLFLENLYYMQLIAWSISYFIHSFNFVLPWSNCDNIWNTKNCFSSKNGKGCASLNMSLPENFKWQNCTNPVSEYWFNYVLKRKNNMADFSEYNLECGLILGICWLLCLYMIYGGLKSSGKILYVTALFPYFCLIVLFFRGITLPGSWNGIKKFFVPNFDQLIDPNVWNDASTQVFFSYGICVGCWIALASRNKFNYDLQSHCITICILNCTTAVFSGICVFAIIGFLAYDEGKPIESVIESGVGLAFIVYPEAALRLPLSSFWSILFFAMLITLGFGSILVMAEAFNKAVIDEFDIIRKHQIIYASIICIISTICGQIFSFSSGIYWFEVFNFYSSSGFAMLFLVFCEMIGIFWIYGSEKYISQIEDMMNFKIHWSWLFLWKYGTPILTAIIFILSIVVYKPLGYENFSFPTWGICFGLFLASLSMCAIPFYPILRFHSIEGSNFFEKTKKLFEANPKVEGLIAARKEKFLYEQYREKK